jgi:palmitoyltransferase
MSGLRLPFSWPSVEDLAIPGVSILILFLAYTSQYLFYYIEPGPLSKNQAIWLNIFVLAIWVCYDRACTVDPGPKGWVASIGLDEGENEDDTVDQETRRKRWCKKCDTVKPPRFHHCRQCGRYASICQLVMIM